MGARVRERTSHLPSATELASMAMGATARGMSPDEIRQVATEAIDKAERLSFFLGKKAQRAGRPPARPPGRLPAVHRGLAGAS